MKDLVKDNYPTIKTLAVGTLQEGSQLLEKNWDHIYSTTMYIPKKAVQVSGEVYINAQEMVFAYTKVFVLLLINFFVHYSSPGEIHVTVTCCILLKVIELLKFLFSFDIRFQNGYNTSGTRVFEQSSVRYLTMLIFIGLIFYLFVQAHSLTEIPHAVVEMAEKYYANLKINGLTAELVKDKAVAFVYVPAQVVSEYLRESRVVQWVVPKSIQTETIEMVEIERAETQENQQQQKVRENGDPTSTTPSETSCETTITSSRRMDNDEVVTQSDVEAQTQDDVEM